MTDEQRQTLSNSMANTTKNSRTSPSAPKIHEIPVSASACAVGDEDLIEDRNFVGLQAAVTSAGSTPGLADDADTAAIPGSGTAQWSDGAMTVGVIFAFGMPLPGSCCNGKGCCCAGRKRRNTSLEPGPAEGRRNSASHWRIRSIFACVV